MGSSAKAAIPALLSAILLGLAFPPLPTFLLVFVAIVPWLQSLRAPNCRPLRSGALFGAIFMGSQMFWLVIFVGKWTGSTGLAMLPWLIATGLLIPFFMLLGWLIHQCYKLNAPWAIPLVWAGVEVLRSTLPGAAFPHAIVAIPLYVVPEIIQHASIGTMFFVSASVVLVNVVLLEVAERAPIRRTIVMASITAGVFMYSVYRHAEPQGGDTKTLVIGQLGTDLAFGDPSTEDMRVGEAVSEIAAKADSWNANLLILPEGLGVASGDSLPQVPFGMPATPVIFGAQRRSDHVYQSAYAFDGTLQSVDKTHLVVFGEYVPFRENLPFLKSFNLPSGDLVPGDKVGLLKPSGIPVGVSICFETLFYDVAATQANMGARLLATISIDDWYTGSGMNQNLLAGTVYRAVENGLPMARAASLGESALIDSRGNMLARAPFGKRFALRTTVKLPEKTDAFAYRSAFPIIAMLSCVGIAIASFASKRKKSAPSN